MSCWEIGFTIAPFRWKLWWLFCPWSFNCAIGPIRFILIWTDARRWSEG